MIGKSLAALAIVRAFGHPLHTSLTISASLAQIGEFSFILAALGVSLGLLPPEGQSLIVAGALLSITLNAARLQADRARRPAGCRPGRDWPACSSRPRRACRRCRRTSMPDGCTTMPSSSATAVSGGRVGGGAGGHARSRTSSSSRTAPPPLALREQGLPVIYGDAARHGVLEHAGARATARLLVVTAPEPFQARADHRRSPDASIPRSTSSSARTATRSARTSNGARSAWPCMGEQELADAMARYALGRFGAAPPT